jgi:hypothetical protein
MISIFQEKALGPVYDKHFGEKVKTGALFAYVTLYFKLKSTI